MLVFFYLSVIVLLHFYLFVLIRHYFNSLSSSQQGHFSARTTIVSISISKKQQLSPTVSIELLARYGHLHYNHRSLQLMMRMNIQYWCATRLPLLRATHIINWLPPIDNPSILTPTELRNSHSHPSRTSNGTSEHHVMILNGHVASLVSLTASGGGRCAHCGEPGAWAYVCEGAWSEWLGEGRRALWHWRHIVISVVRLVSMNWIREAEAIQLTV